MTDIGRVLTGVLADLRALGVESGDLLVVHSSFKSLDLADGSPVDIVKTLRRPAS